MKLKKCLLILSASILATQAYAYNIFNNTTHGLQVKDTAGIRGMNVTIAPNSYASCNPNSGGCSGKLSFKVYAPQANDKVLCSWEGKIDSKSGNYFVIHPVPHVNYPQPGSCLIEYYHD